LLLQGVEHKTARAPPEIPRALAVRCWVAPQNGPLTSKTTRARSPRQAAHYKRAPVRHAVGEHRADRRSRMRLGLVTKRMAIVAHSGWVEHRSVTYDRTEQLLGPIRLDRAMKLGGPWRPIMPIVSDPLAAGSRIMEAPNWGGLGIAGGGLYSLTLSHAGTETRPPTPAFVDGVGSPCHVHAVSALLRPGLRFGGLGGERRSGRYRRENGQYCRYSECFQHGLSPKNCWGKANKTLKTRARFRHNGSLTQNGTRTAWTAGLGGGSPIKPIPGWSGATVVTVTRPPTEAA
jgi:hypothetical protein